MKSIFLIIGVVIFSNFIAFSQDNLILKSGEEHQVKIIEIGLTEITYKKFDNLSGPNFLISKKDVFMIKYENGTKDLFASTQTLPKDSTKTTSQIKLTYRSGGEYKVEKNGMKEYIPIYNVRIDTLMRNTINPDIYKYYSFGKENYRGRKARFVVGLIMTLGGLATTGYGVYALGEYNKNTNPANTSKYGFKSTISPWGDAINTTESYAIPLAGGIIVSNIGLAMFTSAIITINIKDRKLRLAGDLYNQENK